MSLAATLTLMKPGVACLLALLLVQGTGASRELLSSEMNVAHMESLSDMGSGERFSDMSIDPVNEGLAHDIGMESLWHQLLEPLKDTHVAEHLQLCSNAESLAADLPAGSTSLQAALRGASEQLLKANSALLSHVASQSEVAKKKLAEEQARGARPGDTQTFSGVLSRSIEHIVEQLPKDIAQEAKQHENGLDGLAGVVDSLKVVLESCREAQDRSREVDTILNKHETDQIHARHNARQMKQGIPDDPLRIADIREMAKWLYDASKETRAAFMSVMIGSVHSITRDLNGREDRQAPPTPVREESLQGLGQPTEQLINL